MAESAVKISVQRLGAGTAVLNLDGYLDYETSEEVEEAIDALFEEKTYKIAVNLAQTKYISSAGFGCFISSVDIAVRHGGDFVFIAPAPEIKEIFDILGLSKLLRFARDRDQALRMLAETAPG